MSNDNIADSIETAQNLFSHPWQSRHFTALWLGQTFSQFGDNVLLVAIPLTVYSMGRSALQMGIVMALLLFPQVVLLPFTGILVDRVSRSRLMMLTDIVRCLLVATLAVLATAHWLIMPFLYAFVVLYGVMDSLFQPAYLAARAEVFSPDIRNAANGLTQVSQQVARLLGPAVGGMIIGFTSVAAAFWVDTGTFIISIISLVYLRLNQPERGATVDSSGLHNFVHQLTGGYRELRKNPWLWITIGAFAFINIASLGIGEILLPWLIKVHLRMSAGVFGLVTAASGLGGILCALVYGWRRQWRRRGVLAYGGVASTGVAGLGLAFAHSLLMLIILSTISGAGIMVFALTWEGSLQELVAPDAYGRVVSLDMFGSYALLPVGSIVTGWMAATIGGITAIIVESVFIIAIAAAVLFVPAIRRFD